jgi:hypothetical protein
VRLGGLGELGVELQRLQALVLAILIDDVARLLGIERGVRVVTVGERTGRSFLIGAGRRLIVELGILLAGDGRRFFTLSRGLAAERNAL